MATETTQRTDEQNLANTKLRYYGNLNQSEDNTVLLVMKDSTVLSVQSAQYSAFQGLHTIPFKYQIQRGYYVRLTKICSRNAIYMNISQGPDTLSIEIWMLCL